MFLKTVHGGKIFAFSSFNSTPPTTNKLFFSFCQEIIQKTRNHHLSIILIYITKDKFKWSVVCGLSVVSGVSSYGECNFS